MSNLIPTSFDQWGNALLNNTLGLTPKPSSTSGVNLPGSPRQPNTNALTIAPNLADIDVANNINQLSNTTNTSLSSVFLSDGISPLEYQAAMEYRNAFKQGDVITALRVFYNNLFNVYFKDPSFSLDSILYWYQKLKYSNKEITSYITPAAFYNQNILPNQIPSLTQWTKNTINNIKGDPQKYSYFDIESDSIGVIANSKFIQLDSTLPIFDVDQQYYGVPIPYAASMDSKISATTRNVCYNLSQKTTVYMRRNLLNIGYTNVSLQQNLAADSTTSHGLNLINDLPTFVNINKFLNQLKNKIVTTFSQTKISSFVQYLNTIGNTTALNLRDIFPLSPSDVDFNVITSEERAMASVAIAQQEQADAAAAAALAYQQSTNNFTGNPTSLTDHSNPTAGDLMAPSGTVSINDKSSDRAARNAAMDASGMKIDTYKDSNGNTYMDKDSFLAYTQARLEGPPASPLIGANFPDAASFGVTDTSDSSQWAEYMWKVAQAEQGGKVNATGNDTTNDSGGSWGAFSNGVADAKVYAGYSGVTIGDLQSNPTLSTNVGISTMEKEMTQAGSVAGMYRYGGGSRASFASTTATNVKKMV